MFAFIPFNTLIIYITTINMLTRNTGKNYEDKCQEYSHMSFDLDSRISTMSGVTNVNPPASSAFRRHVTCFDAVHVFSPKLASSRANVSTVSDNERLFTSTVQMANRSPPTTLETGRVVRFDPCVSASRHE